MKVQEVMDHDEDDGRSSLEILVDGKRAFKVRDGEPEDSNLNRDFEDCYKVLDLMRQAHEAGARGEPFEIVPSEIEEE